MNLSSTVTLCLTSSYASFHKLSLELNHNVIQKESFQQPVEDLSTACNLDLTLLLIAYQAPAMLKSCVAMTSKTQACFSSASSK
jgi:hypothetical protein